MSALAELRAPERGGPPVYRQIATQIRSRIEAGELAEGERLPPIRRLAGQLGVNRDTVALAYEELAAAGLLESMVGRGTFVRSARLPAARPQPVELPLAAPVERLLAFENARVHVGASEGAVPLHSLIPDPAFYPVESFRRALNRALVDGGADLLLYGAPEGHAGLREALAERLRAAGCSGWGRVDAEHLVLCHGASQGIALALRLFAQMGEAVAVEVPTYHNVLSTLTALGLRAAPVPLGPDGVDLDALDAVLARPEVKAFYTIPTFHNPMGTTTDVTHRRGLLEVAARHGVPVIEDGFEADLRFEGREVPALTALDERGQVVHLSSFSKSLFPGARVGAILASGRVLDGLLALKHSTDLSDSMPLQAALADFLRSGGYDRHLGRMRKRLRGRRDALVEALEREMPEGTRWTHPLGGYQVWVELPFDVDTRDLLPDAVRAGVLFAPGSQFLPDRGRSRGLRLTLARADEDEIRRGIAALGQVSRDLQARDLQGTAVGERRSSGVNM